MIDWFFLGWLFRQRMGCNGPLVGGLFTVSTALGVLSLPFALGVLGKAV